MTEGIDYRYERTDAEGSHRYLRPIVSRMLRPLPKGSTVLDLGCGNGSFLASMRGQGWDLIGTDFSPSGIRIAEQAYPDIRFVLADAQSDLSNLLPLADAIVSTEVIEHLYDPQAFIRTAFALLKPGGVFIVSTPYHGYLKNLFLAASGKMDRHFTVLWDHGHIKFWSADTLSQALKQAGFDVKEFCGAGRIPLLWKSMVLRCGK